MTSAHSSYINFAKYLSADTMATIEADLMKAWSWTTELSGLPPIYDQVLINTNECQISNKRPMYHKAFCGNKFKIGGNKNV